MRLDRGQVWRGAVGRGELRPNRPAVPRARFRAASVTKQLTSVLALQMVQRGRWRLGTTIADVLPRGAWPGRGDVTLRQLLSHTSGMPDVVDALVARARTNREFVRIVSRRYTDRGLVRSSRRLPWVFTPGTDHDYSNTNFIVVGLMLKQATGQTLYRLMRQRVLRPAGMRDSYVPVAKYLTPPRLHEYASFGRARLDLGTFSPTMFSGAGALVSTAADLNRFHLALSRGRLIPRRLVTLMRTPVRQSGATRYGLGSYRLADPCGGGFRLVGHDGGAWGTLTLSFTSPDGARRVTAALTGRQYTTDRALRALFRFVGVAFGTTCRGGPAGVAGRTQPPPSVLGRLAP